MFHCLAKKLCLNSCIFSMLVIVLLTVKAQSIEYSQWKPIQWYVAGNITFGTAVSKLNDHKRNAPASSKEFKWKYINHERISGAENGFINGEEEVPPEGIDWQETSRSVAEERSRDVPQTVWTTEENSGDLMKAESKEEEGEPRKKKKKLLKKLALPLLVLYKLKFLMLIPVLVTAMVLLSGSSGLVGFFFSLFATMMAYDKEH